MPIKSVPIQRLLPYLYELSKIPEDMSVIHISNLHLLVKGQLTPWMMTEHDHWLCSDYQDRLTYLCGSYLKGMTQNGDLYEFSKGCISQIVSDDGILMIHFREKSEWFRKLYSDLYFIRWVTKDWDSPMELYIPKAFIRRLELPTMLEWCKAKQIKVHPWHQKIVDHMLKTPRYLADECIHNPRINFRRYLCRYWFLMGKLTEEELHFYKGSRHAGFNRAQINELKQKGTLKHVTQEIFRKSRNSKTR